jgi:hypothetical protein
MSRLLARIRFARANTLRRVRKEKPGVSQRTGFGQFLVRSLVAFGAVTLTAAAFAAVAGALRGPIGHSAKLSKRPHRGHVFVSLSGDDSTCVRGDAGKPCATFEGAYRVAQQGDLVQVAAGTYPGQEIDYDSSKSSAAGGCRLIYNGDGTFSSSTAGCVTFEPAPGASVQVGAHTRTTADLNMYTTSTIPVVSTADFYPVNGVIAVTLGRSWWKCTGMDASDLTGCTPRGGSCSTFLCGWDKGTDVVEGGVKVLGGSFADFKGLSAATISVNSDGTHAATDVLFDGDTAAYGYWNGSYLFVEYSSLGGFNGSQPNTYTNCSHCGIYDTTVHDERLDHCDGSLSGQATNPLCHGDGFIVENSTNAYFVGSTFYGNDVFHIFFGHGATANPGPVTIANNYFGNCGPITGCSAPVSIRGDTGDTLDSYTITGNSSNGGWLIGANAGATSVSLTNWQVDGNILGRDECPSEPGGWNGRWGVRFVNNIGAGPACASSFGPIARGNLRTSDIAMGDGRSLWRKLGGAIQAGHQ